MAAIGDNYYTTTLPLSGLDLREPLALHFRNVSLTSLDSQLHQETTRAQNGVSM